MASVSGDRPAVEVRGLYTTALTVLLWEAGFTIARPSATVRSRLGLPDHPGPAAVLIEDRPDRHGVNITGESLATGRVVQALRRRLPFAPFWREASRAVLCFPLPVTYYLDTVRARYAPTIPGYHRLRLLGLQPPAPEGLDLGAGIGLLARLEAEWVWSRLQPGQPFVLRHQKPDGRKVSLRGTVERVETGRLVVIRRRFRPGGVFDSLGEPILPGDWGLVELWAGHWWSRRLYFREDGRAVGEVININTPVELLPDGSYYVDLEVDLVRLPDGTVRIVDLPDLEQAVRRGHLSPALAQRAYEEACRLALAMATGVWPIS